MIRAILSAAAVLALVSSGHAQPSNIIVIYDGDTMNVVEIDVPDTEAEAESQFATARHPELANPQVRMIPYTDAETMGIIPAIKKDAPDLNIETPAGVTPGAVSNPNAPSSPLP